MKKGFGKSVFVGLTILAVCAMFLASQPTPKKFRVGTFDSRAIAIAYARSELHAPDMKNLRAKYEKAKAEKDEKTIKECEAEGPAQQQILHQQGFSIASVADILEKVKADLPKVAQETGVDLIVSKWEVAHAEPSIEIVDVTANLVKLFKPDERTLKILEELSKQPPVPLLDLLLSPEK
jgi:hypothetical protein